MPFDAVMGDLSELLEAKARAREADMRAILEGRATLAEIHEKNAFFKNVNEWCEVDRCLPLSEEESISFSITL